MKRFVVILVALVALMAVAQQRPETYNYKRGMEALFDNNYSEAIEYFKKEISDNPKNGYPYAWIAMIWAQEEEYGQALTAADKAIKLLPKNDPEFVASAYSVRGDVYLNLKDTTRALADMSMVIKQCPEDESYRKKRAQLYYEQRRYDMSDADYRKIIEYEPGSVTGYMGIGRNALMQERWDDAIKQFDYVLMLASDYSSAYSFRAEAYMGKQMWKEATDDVVSALKLDMDLKALALACKLEEPAFTMLVSKIRIQSAKEPNVDKWPFVAGFMHECKKQYAKAIDYYNAANDRDPSAGYYYRVAWCQSELGDYDSALSNIDRALDMDTTDLDYMEFRANMLYEVGRAKAAIEEFDRVLSVNPEYGWGYHSRGWYKDMIGDKDGALDDYSVAIVLDPEYSYSYLCRANIYKEQGNTALAEDDFKKVIELEETSGEYAGAQHAYLGLGQYDKAKAVMDSIIARDEDRAGSYYDAACLYSRMRDKNNALMFLEKSLEMGFKRFAHMALDTDLDYIRDSEEFLALMRKYTPQRASKDTAFGIRDNEAFGSCDNVASNKMTVYEIPFTKEDGVCKVKCRINGLPLHFVFDTGASDVTLSMVEATFMMKNGYLSASDVVGSRRYMDANGDVSVGTVINLKTVNFGGQELNNIRASVVQNQKAPLLLGQSVLARLGKIEIDNARKVIKIMTRARL